MSVVTVAVVDVGANTLRLLVATRDDRGRIEPIREDRRQLGLGEELERTGGFIGDEKLQAVAEASERHVRRALKLGSSRTVVLVTSPGRQARNGAALVAALRTATECDVRVLDADEEGTLAWHGAVAASPAPLPETVAVCDVGGGSAQVVVGTLDKGPTWSRSLDLGSLRLTKRFFAHDPPLGVELANASAEVARRFAEIVPPLPAAALATGGTARALRRIVGRELDRDGMATAVRLLASRPSREIARDFGIDRQRARTVTAGTIVLAEVQRRLCVPFTAARGGLREGAASALLDALARATA
jgi:exopolyphosphatase/guanosine-5'-triphosphate,3'-diphosphate pyrophosphatase